MKSMYPRVNEIMGGGAFDADYWNQHSLSLQVESRGGGGELMLIIGTNTYHYKLNQSKSLKKNEILKTST